MINTAAGYACAIACVLHPRKSRRLGSPKRVIKYVGRKEAFVRFALMEVTMTWGWKMRSHTIRCKCLMTNVYQQQRNNHNMKLTQILQNAQVFQPQQPFCSQPLHLNQQKVNLL